MRRRGWWARVGLLSGGLVAGSLFTGATLADEAVGLDQLQSTLWMQWAPEYRAATQQVYRLATERIAHPQPGSAALEQSTTSPEQLARLPTAVVLDLDETVLDNSVYQARLVRDRAKYDTGTWGEWVMEARAEAVPGAREFIAAARRLGIAVFYVSNRDCATPAGTAEDPCPAKTATLRNLVTLGIEPTPDPKRMLLRGERPEWATKSQRRAFIASQYRIIAMVGDDLGDFVDPRTFAGDRARLEWRFGVNWFVLPNPVYGSWTNRFESLEDRRTALRVEPAVLELPGIGPWSPNEKRVRLATWNVEYLMTPETHTALRAHCAEQGGMVGGEDRTLPCAITRRDPRTAEDFAALRRYAAELRADIVALQEVDGPEAAALVFPGYDYCLSTRGHTQKNGFAIRRGLPHRCEPEYEPLSVDNAVRRGVVVTFFPGTVNEFRLMSVHLKSGCPAGPLTAPGRNCDLLARQVGPLEAWIEEEAKAGRRFGVLGDFNRRFSLEKGPARDEQGRLLNVYAEIDDGEPAASKLTDITARARFIPCTRGSEYREYIDTVLLGRDLARSIERKSFLRVTFSDEDANARWLSDHCPVGIALRLQ
jgi:5'-nucleotidase (lipoprotein e(P4) family)